MAKKQNVVLFGPDGKPLRASGLYPNPDLTTGKYRPRSYTTATDTYKSVDISTRNNLLRYSREFYAQLPNINGAVNSKANWGFGSGWEPQFNGNNKQWADEAYDWLMNKWFPICNVRGQNFDFRTSLYLSSIAIDVDGEVLMVLVKTPSGFPLIRFIRSHRIGTRSSNGWVGGDKVMDKGPYKGLRMIDGVIVNNSLRPLAYSVLGDKQDASEDLLISVQSAFLLYEPKYTDQVRGIPASSAGLLDSIDFQDCEFFIRRQIKLDSSQGIMHTNETGEPDESANILTDEDAGLSATPNVLHTEYIQGGEIMYFKAGGKLEPYKSDRPSPNVEAFLGRIERRILYAIGWPIEMVDPSKVGGASVRLITDMTRQSISHRQNTVERKAKIALAYALSNAMEMGLISDNREEDNWWDWSFNRPATIVIDQGYESQADREAMKLGQTTLSAIAQKQGKNWYDIREQTTIETEDLLDRAYALMKKYPDLNLSAAINLLSQRASAGVSISTTKSPPNEAQPDEGK